MNVQTALHTLALENLDHPDEIHVAYRRLVKRWHPDQFPRNSEMQSMAEERLKQINQAQAVLNEHIKKLLINNENIIKNKNKIKNPRNGNRLMDWLCSVFNRGGRPPQDSRNAGAPRHHSKPPSGMDVAGFDRILRHARNSQQRQPDDAPPITRRTMSVIHHKRRSTGTRIEGFRSASPVLPIRRVRRIDPIEGSE
ncbi:MAG: J domain-containing protein [Desulfobacteraceae bacterium]